MTMRVLIVDESPERTAVLREGLERAGYEVAAALAAPIELLRAVEEVQPEVIIIDTDSPSRDVLEHVVMISRDEPRPIVMFSGDDAPRAELVEANLKLSERKLVERAKGILMKSRGMAEDEAYQALRRMAMDRGKRLGEIAQQIIDVTEFLG